jgi:hypothetical protein
MSETNGLAAGAQRAAETALRNCGGGTVFLRLPAPAAAGDDGEQLGLATPAFNDLPLGPAVFTPTSTGGTLRLSLPSVRQAVQTLSAADAAALWESAAGVVLDGLLYVITSVRTDHAAGEPYLYTLTLLAPVGR